MSENYKIVIEQEGLNHVKIFKYKDGRFVNDWNFSLKGDDEPIIFKEFYTETKFVIINWDGWVRLYDVSTQATLLDYKLKGKIDTRAVLALDKSKLYVAFSQDSNQSYLATFDLDTLQKTAIELPDIYNESLQIRKDGNLLFYKHDWEHVDKIKIYKHFYSVLDPNVMTIEQFELPFAPQFSFNESKPVVDIKNNSVIMPAFGDVAFKTNSSGETVFECLIVLLDLNTFEILQLLSVRDFPKNQLGCTEYDGEEMANQFLSSPKTEDYSDAVRDFYENLTTIKIVSDGFWLCWRGGILRKVDSDFNLSPLLVTSSRPRSSGLGMFQDHYFHSHLYHIDSSSIMLAEALDFYKTPMPNLDIADLETPIALELENTSLDEFYLLSYSNEKQSEIENRDKIPIQVKDFSTKKSFVDALVQIEMMVSDLKTQEIGSTLIFGISDTKGKTLEEPAFFAKAVEYAPELIKSIIEKFIQIKKAKYLYRTAEETALCHAVFELAKKGDSYLDITLQYLAAIDLDHDVFNIENVLPILEETYTAKELKKKMQAISKALAEWYQNYCQE